MENNIYKTNNKSERKLILSLLLVVSMLVNSLNLNIYASEKEEQIPLNVDPFLHMYEQNLEYEKAKSTIATLFSSLLSTNAVMPIESSILYYADQELNGIGDVAQILLARNGNNTSSYLAPSRLYWENPSSDVAHVGYCVNPTLGGWNDGGSKYNVDITSFGDDITLHNGQTPDELVAAGSTTIEEALKGIVTYGFPVTSAETLLGGTSSDFGTTDAHLHYAAYVATKYAGWAIVDPSSTPVSAWSVNSSATTGFSTELKQTTLNAISTIYNQAIHYDDDR